MIYTWDNLKKEDLSSLAEEILKNHKSLKIAFFGDLGAGKTTFIKELCKHIGIENIVNSPTFTLLNEYNYNGKKVFHFDFYRIKDPVEILELGFEEYFYSDHYVFIEWPEKIRELLPAFFSKFYITIQEPETRSIIWEI
jgi:tRNA threonylcarbamoyladenosine biosynthesis protein TsaE